jgi:hypothetical protein
VITDPYAHTLSVRCGVVPTDAGTTNASTQIQYVQIGGKYNAFVRRNLSDALYRIVTPQDFSVSWLLISTYFQYTRPRKVNIYHSPPNIF